MFLTWILFVCLTVMKKRPYSIRENAALLSKAGLVHVVKSLSSDDEELQKEMRAAGKRVVMDKIHELYSELVEEEAAQVPRLLKKARTTYPPRTYVHPIKDIWNGDGPDKVRADAEERETRLLAQELAEFRAVYLLQDGTMYRLRWICRKSRKTAEMLFGSELVSVSMSPCSDTILRAKQFSVRTWAYRALQHHRCEWFNELIRVLPVKRAVATLVYSYAQMTL